MLLQFGCYTLTPDNSVIMLQLLWRALQKNLWRKNLCKHFRMDLRSIAILAYIYPKYNIAYY